MNQHDSGLDPLLPVQVLYRRADSPERRLLAAVLEDAVHMFQQLHGAQRFRGRRLFREVENWFASERTDHLFTFVRICDVLGLDAGWIRSGLARWREDRAQSGGVVVILPRANTAPTTPSARAAS